MKKLNKELSLQKNILYNSVGMSINLACQWLTTVLVLRLSSDFTNSGLLTLAMSVTNIFYAIATFNLRAYQVSDVKGKYKDYVYLQVRTVTCLAAFLCCLVYSAVFYRDVRFIGITLYMVFRVIEGYIDILQGFAQRAMRMDLAGKSMAFRGVLSLMAFAAILAATDSFNLAVIGMIGSALFVMVFFDVRYSIMLANIRGKVEFSTIKTILVECLPMGIANALSTSIISIPRNILDMLEGQEALGIYGALAVPTVIIQVAATYVFNPMLPVYAVHYNKKEKASFYRLFYKTVALIVLLSAVALGGAYLLQDFLLPFLLGDDIIPYIGLFIPMLICTIANAVVWFLTSILVVIRDFKTYLYVSLLAAVLSLLTGYFFIKKYSMAGVNYTLYFVMAVQILAFCIILFRRLRKHFQENTQ